MAKNYKRYLMWFRERAVERMKLGENVSQLARALGDHRLRVDYDKRLFPPGPEPSRQDPEQLIE